MKTVNVKIEKIVGKKRIVIKSNTAVSFQQLKNLLDVASYRITYSDGTPVTHDNIMDRFYGGGGSGVSDIIIHISPEDVDEETGEFLGEHPTFDEFKEALNQGKQLRTVMDSAGDGSMVISRNYTAAVTSIDGSEYDSIVFLGMSISGEVEVEVTITRKDNKMYLGEAPYEETPEENPEENPEA